MTAPSVFAGLDFKEAEARASAEDKLLLVVATSAKSGVMDSTSYTAALLDLLAAEFVVVHIDIDEQPELARKLGVRATPTRVVFCGEKELGRLVGSQTADQLGAWLDVLPSGAGALARARAAVVASPDDVGAHVQLARRLFRARLLEEAADELAWQWEHAPAAARQFPQNFLLWMVLRENAPARERFEVFRARVEPRDGAAPDPDELADWMCLNAAFGDDDATLLWFDRVRDRIDERGPLAHVVQKQIVPLLMAHGRWADAGRLLTDPMSRLEQVLRQDWLEAVGDLVRALCAAERDDDAAQVIERACSVRLSPEMDEIIGDALPERVLAAARALGPGDPLTPP